MQVSTENYFHLSGFLEQSDWGSTVGSEFHAAGPDVREAARSFTNKLLQETVMYCSGIVFLWREVLYLNCWSQISIQHKVN